MPKLSQNLILDRCPHCAIANPNLFKQHHLETRSHDGQDHRWWYIYTCGRCGGVVSASAPNHGNEVTAHFPTSKTVKEDIPERPRAYLQQALESLHAPAGAVMLAASAVDAMLKAKGYADGNLYGRIEKAANDHVITADMAKWAHEVRLDANDQRHADQAASLPTADDASRTIDFAAALAELLFVLPARVQRGIAAIHDQAKN
jgi:hypothetical protein